MRAGICVVVVAIACTALAAAGGPKPPQPTCRVTFQEVPGDKLYGDGAGYEHGKEGVTCTVDLTQGSLHYGDMNLGFATGKTTRYFAYEGQSDTPDGPGFNSFHDNGTLVLRQLWTVGLSAPENRAFTAYAYNSQFSKGSVRFRANANFEGDSVRVTRTGSCTWVVSFDSTSNDSGTTWMDGWEGIGWHEYRGRYQIPFHFLVDVISGCQ